MLRVLLATVVALVSLLALATSISFADDLTVAPVEPTVTFPGPNGACCIIMGPPPGVPASAGSAAHPAGAGGALAGSHETDQAAGSRAAGGASAGVERTFDPGDNPGHAGGR